MLLVKSLFLGILIQFVSAEKYFGWTNNKVVGNLSLQKRYQSMVKTLFQYLKQELNAEDLLQQLKLNSSSSASGCINQLVSMNGKQLLSAIDASFKIPPGILMGNLNWIGNYRECMETDGLHYCTMPNIMFGGVPVVLGLCVPEQCHADDITNIFILLGKQKKANQRRISDSQIIYDGALYDNVILGSHLALAKQLQLR